MPSPKRDVIFDHRHNAVDRAPGGGRRVSTLDLTAAVIVGFRLSGLDDRRLIGGVVAGYGCLSSGCEPGPSFWIGLRAVDQRPPGAHETVVERPVHEPPVPKPEQGDDRCR